MIRATLLLILGTIAAATMVLSSSPVLAAVNAPPPAVKRALLADGYKLFRSARTPNGGMAYSSGRRSGANAFLMRVALQRKSAADARVYARAVWVQPARSQYAALAARDAGATGATIFKVRAIASFTVIDFRMTL